MPRVFPSRQVQPAYPAYLVAPDNFVFPLLIQILNFQEISSNNRSKREKRSLKRLQILKQCSLRDYCRKRKQSHH